MMICRLVFRKDCLLLSHAETIPKFDSGRLRYAIDEMVEMVTGDTSTLMVPSDLSARPYVFVVSLQGSSLTSNSPNIFRTYDSSQASISEALLETIADPTFFSPLRQERRDIHESGDVNGLDEVDEGKSSFSNSQPTSREAVDKPPEYNTIVSDVERSNPAKVAINEAIRLWKGISHISILNIGSGKQYNDILFSPSDLTNATIEKIGDQVDIIATQLMSLVTDYTFTNSIGRMALQMSVKCEAIYNEVITHSGSGLEEPKPEACARFNVDKGVDLNQGYEEWKEFESLETATIMYMEDPAQQLHRRECVQTLLNPVAGVWNRKSFFIVPYERNPHFIGRI